MSAAARHFEQAAADALGLLVLVAQVGAGNGVHELFGLVVGEVHDGVAAQLLGVLRGLGVRDLGAAAQRRCGGGRAGGEGAQEGQCRPPAYALAAAVGVLLGDALAHEVQGALEELAVLGGELVVELADFPRARGMGCPPAGSGGCPGAAALDEELSEPFAVLAVSLAAEVRRETQELFVEQGKE